MLGIEKLKVLVFGLLAMAKQSVISLKDGYQNEDLFPLINSALPVLASISSIGQVADELNDLDADEKAELVAEVKEKFDLPDNKDAEEKIEWAVDMSATSWRGYRLFVPKSTDSETPTV